MRTSALENQGIRTSDSLRAWVSLAASAAGVALLGWGLIWATQRYIHSLNEMASVSPDDAIARAGFSLRVLALVMGALALGTAWHTARSCSRVLIHRQIPPPGSWVLGRPTVVSGTRAVIWGRVGYVLAALLAVIGIVCTYLMWQFVDLMMSGVGTLGI